MAEGTFFNELVVEFFEKDDSMNDPLLVFDPIGNRLLRYIAKLPLSEGFIDEQPWPDWAPRVDVLVRMANDTRKVFSQLERPWHHQKVTLVDLKIEFGRLPDGTIVVADVIDNDSWRIWPSGDKAQMKDKQVYRDLANAEDPAALAKELGKIKENYAWVAEATRAFLTV
jgi:phosphoribosylaminoimidazole-succinocarboxamide synthase